MLKNSFYNGVYKCLSLIFPFFSSIYVARVLTPLYIGKVSAAINMVSFFSIFFSMGIPTYGIKLIAQFSKEKSLLGKAFSELWVINLQISIVASILFYITISYVSFFKEDRLLYSITGLILVINIFNVDWFFQGIQEYKYIALRSLFVKIASFCALFIFVHEKSDYLIYALLNVFALCGNYLLNIIRIRKYIRFQLKGLYLKEHISHILALSGASLAAEVYTLTDTAMLNITSGPKIVGFYSTSMNIIRVLRGLVVAMTAVLLPQLSYYYHNDEKSKFTVLVNKGFNALILITVPVAVGIILVSKDMTLLFFGAEYYESVLSTQILAVSVISVALSNYIGLQILVILGREAVVTISTVIGAIVNVILNFILIVKFQHTGAAIASAVTEIAVTVFQICNCRKYIQIKVEFTSIIIATVAMVVSVIIIKQVISIILLRLVLECFCGAVVYFLCAYILGNTLLRKIFLEVKQVVCG